MKIYNLKKKKKKKEKKRRRKYLLPGIKLGNFYAQSVSLPLRDY